MDAHQCFLLESHWEGQSQGLTILILSPAPGGCGGTTRQPDDVKPKRMSSFTLGWERILWQKNLGVEPT